MKPNVILITLDAVRADALTAELMPQLHQFALANYWFDCAIAAGPWTQAAFPALLTSTYPAMYGGCTGPLSLARPSTIEAFAGAGYDTAAIINHPLLGRRFGYQRGFNVFHELAPTEKEPRLRSFRGGQALMRNRYFQSAAARLGYRLAPPRLYVPAATVVERSLETLANLAAPLFLWVHFMDAHWPYHLDEHRESPRQLAQAWHDVAHLHEARWSAATVSDEMKGHYRALYDAALGYMDHHLGRLLAGIEQTAVSETIIAIVADHGEEFWEHGRHGHIEDAFYDEVLRVPLIIRLPGILPSRRISEQVSGLDLMPTLFDLTGCAPPSGMLGRSLKPLLQNVVLPDDPDAVIAERLRDSDYAVAVRTAENKYIWSSYAATSRELYNLVDDPDEQVNLAPRSPELVRELHSYVEKQQQLRSKTMPEHLAKDPVLDEALSQRLRGLGYVE